MAGCLSCILPYSLSEDCPDWEFVFCEMLKNLAKPSKRIFRAGSTEVFLLLVALLSQKNLITDDCLSKKETLPVP